MTTFHPFIWQFNWQFNWGMTREKLSQGRKFQKQVCWKLYVSQVEASWASIHPFSVTTVLIMVESERHVSANSAKIVHAQQLFL